VFPEVRVSCGRLLTKTTKPQVSRTLLLCRLPVIPKNFRLETLMSEIARVHDDDANTSTRQENPCDCRDEERNRKAEHSRRSLNDSSQSVSHFFSDYLRDASNEASRSKLYSLATVRPASPTRLRSDLSGNLVMAPISKTVEPWIIQGGESASRLVSTGHP